MLVQYHIEMCRRALSDVFSPAALETIIAANIAQDNLRGQIGHPEFHFDNSAFAAGNLYLEQQRQESLTALSQQDADAARRAFGRLTHAAQDFYAHSNYIALWLARYPAEGRPAPPQVDPLDPEILQHPELRSGRVYPLEALTYLPALRPLVRRLLPPDAHIHMNLDYPARGPLFPYALEAAVKRTRHELHRTLELLPAEQHLVFLGA
ncbi:MAG: hypothetical protein D6803_03985 [Anaerolineae bacterium]|nr:MAG: hypothetical protein D6803_03985 [Anaerolineae bacterium]